MQVTITSAERVQRTARATGKPFISLTITTKEHGSRKLSGFGNKVNETWKVGDVVEIEVEQKGEYLNFSMPRATPAAGDLKEVLDILKFKIMPMLVEIRDGKPEKGYEYPTADINPDEMPF